MDMLNATNGIREKQQVYSTCIKKCLNAEFFLVHIVPYFDLMNQVN